MVVAVSSPPAGAEPAVAAAEPVLERASDPSATGSVRWHALAYLVLLIGLLAGTNLRASWSADDGAYATQVKVIRATGHWAYPYRHLDIDPHIEHAPISHAVVTSEDQLFAYVKLPAWIDVLRLSTAVFGLPLGLYVPSVLGALGAASVGWFLAKRFDRAAAPWAFWAVALSPLLVHTTAMWAHTTAAALGGVVALFVLDAADGRFGRRHAVGLACTLAAMLAIRDEGALLTAAALPVIAVLCAPAGRSLLRRLAGAASATVLAGLAAVGSFGVSHLWAHRIAPGTWGGPVEVGYAVGWLQGRIMGAQHTLLDGSGTSATGTTLAVLATLLLLAGGWVLGRRRDAGPAALLMGAGLAALVVRTVFVQPLDLAGYAAASPLVVVAVGGADWRSLGRRGRSLAAVCGLYLLAVLATEYPEGGSRDWGGRFLFLALVPVAVGAVLVGRRMVAALDGTDGSAVRKVAAGALIALVAVPALTGVYATEHLRNGYAAMTRSATSTDSAVVIRMPRFRSRLSWDVLPDADWLTADPQSAVPLLAKLKAQHVGPVTVAGWFASTVHAPGYRRDVRAPDLVVFTPTR